MNALNALTAGRRTRRPTLAIAAGLLAGAVGCGDDGPTGPRLEPSAEFAAIELPRGFRIEKVVGGLSFPTSVTWDAAGAMYVAEAGGAFLEEPPPARILRVQNGQATEAVSLGSTVGASLVGLTFFNGAFYITHRDPDNLTGAVSRVTPGGAVTRILSGIQDSRSEHQINAIRVGPDKRMYVAVGPATNSGVVGLDLAPFTALSPDLKATPCVDYVLRGVNFRTPDFRTEEDPTDNAMTGAFVPFGTMTTAGQRIPAVPKCGGSILAFDPVNAEGTVKVYAHGFRNVIDVAFDSARGTMYAAVNGYDVRGSRPVNDEWDATYRVREGAWYGWPDFSATLEPLDAAKFDSPDQLQAAAFIGTQELPKDRVPLLLDLAASNLQRPDRGLVAGLHEFGSSPSGLAVAPASMGDMAGHLFVAEWGDLSPPTNPLRDEPTGYRVSRIVPGSDRAQPFVQNARRGPASGQGAMGQGIERPFDVKFGPDGAMYIVDFGVARPNPVDAGPGDDPYEFLPRTGALWRVTRATGGTR